MPQEISKSNELPVFDILPKHVGFIMDGNGRWAKQRGLPRSEGHKEGAKTFRKIGGGNRYSDINDDKLPGR